MSGCIEAASTFPASAMSAAVPVRPRRDNGEPVRLVVSSPTRSGMVDAPDKAAAAQPMTMISLSGRRTNVASYRE